MPRVINPHLDRYRNLAKSPPRTPRLSIFSSFLSFPHTISRLVSLIISSCLSPLITRTRKSALLILHFPPPALPPPPSLPYLLPSVQFLIALHRYYFPLLSFTLQRLRASTALHIRTTLSAVSRADGLPYIVSTHETRLALQSFAHKLQALLAPRSVTPDPNPPLPSLLTLSALLSTTATLLLSHTSTPTPAVIAEIDRQIHLLRLLNTPAPAHLELSETLAHALKSDDVATLQRVRDKIDAKISELTIPEKNVPPPAPMTEERVVPQPPVSLTSLPPALNPPSPNPSIPPHSRTHVYTATGSFKPSPVRVVPPLRAMAPLGNPQMLLPDLRHALARRSSSQPETVVFDMDDEYGGCGSNVNAAEEVALGSVAEERGVFGGDLRFAAKEITKHKLVQKVEVLE